MMGEDIPARLEGKAAPGHNLMSPEITMDASEFFNTVVKRNYEEWTGFTGNQDDFRLLWNAIVSMNTVPEYLALDQLGYAQVSREVLDGTAKQIRDKDKSLIDLKFCAETLKHVRKIPRKQKQGSVTITISSTIASPIDRDTWTICSHDLIDVAERAFKALSALPELR
jgi:hypothetical protein